MITYNKIKSKTLENIYPIRILKKKKKAQIHEFIITSLSFKKGEEIAFDRCGLG